MCFLILRGKNGLFPIPFLFVFTLDLLIIFFLQNLT